MGFDITIFIEYKKHDKWCNFQTEEFDHGSTRSYLLFDIMASGREIDSPKCIFQPRGFPENAAHFTKKDYLQTEHNSFCWSYLYTSEFEKVLNELLKYDATPNFYMRVILGIMKVLEREGAQQSRIVFWFDA